MNLHSTTKHLKHSLNFESAKNVQSLNVVEFEFELHHIFIHDFRDGPIRHWPISSRPIIGT